MIPFSVLVSTFQRLEETSERLKMFEILANLFQQSSVEEIDKIVYFCQGELLPSFHGVEMGMSDKYLIRAIAKGSGALPEQVSVAYQERGDIGSVAERFFGSPETESEISVVGVYEAVYQIAMLVGEGSVEKKMDALARLFSSVSGMEAKYIARFVVGKLRLGVGNATLLEALAASKGERKCRVALNRGYHVTSDLGEVAKTFYQFGIEGIRQLSVKVGSPIQPALCERLSSAEEIIRKIGRCSVEMKYDGLRCQVHKNGSNVILFSRSMERTTPMFPEIVEAIQMFLPNDTLIIEGEVLAFDEASGTLLPFQTTMQRKRKHGIGEKARAYPLKLYAFDLLYHNGVDYTERGYRERRGQLERLVPKNPVIELSQVVETEDSHVVAHVFEAAVEQGLEGIIAKRLDAPYALGSRNFNWIKLKRSYKGALSDSLDLVIVGYNRGHGQRARWGMGTVLAAVYDSVTDRYQTVSKVGTGFSEEALCALKILLDDHLVSEKPKEVDSLMVPDQWVCPKYVISVLADEITRSPNHTAGRGEDGMGYALRFPRVQGFVREDKKARDVTDTSEIIAMFNKQKRVAI